jgi:PHD/YefM family antitoxin component YafN of YafNO toxin-antitoxin module
VRIRIMRHVGIREFWDRATGFLREAEPIAVERHGKVVGFYIPVESKRGEQEELKEALARLDASVKRVLEETGMTEDELADYFDPSRPAPELPPDRHSSTAATLPLPHASSK